MTSSTGAVTVRTNLYPDPSFETSSAPWWINNGPGTMAVSTEQKYLGLQSLKVVPGQENWGYHNPIQQGIITAGKTYTFSIYVYSPTAQTMCLTNYHTPVQGPSVDVPAGQWTRLHLTQAIPAGAPSAFLSVRAPNRTTILSTFYMDAYLVEESPLLGSYFDGATAAAGDFTFAWSGTANASTSVQRGTNVFGWSSRWHGSTGGTGVTYQSNDNPLDGVFQRKLWKTANTGPANDTGTGHSTRTPVVAGTTYTASIMARCSVSQRFSIFVDWHDAAGAVLSRSGPTDLGAMSTSFTRFAYTAIAPANAVTANIVFGPYTNATPMPAGTTLDFDQCLIEASPALGTFFDGATVAAGDFTYVWSGTSHASTSFQRGTGIAGSFATGNGSALVQSSDWSAGGPKSCRIVPNGTTASTDTFATASPGQLPVGTYTILATCRVATVQTGTLDSRARRIQTYHSNTATAGSQAPNAVGVYPLRLTFKITDGAAYQSFRLYNGASVGNGDIWWDNIMIVEGEYTGDYVDGTKPLSKWDGTANSSTSVGYPPQLLDIAGKPVLDVSAVGFTTLGGGFTNTEPRTFYTVYSNILDISSEILSLVLYGSNALNDSVPNSFTTLRQQASSNPGNNLLVRRSGGGGPLVSFSRVSANVACWGVNGSGYLFLGLNNGALTTDDVTMDIPHEKIEVSPNNAAGSHIRTIMYRGFHDAATRQAVSRYLGNKYGANVV